WAETPESACEQVISLCATAEAQRVLKSKSMITEEISLNPALVQAGFEVIETDLGEYIIQLAQEPPSHIIAPAVHKTKEQVAALFYQYHQDYGFKDRLSDIPQLVAQARQVLRQKFITADVGITGANFLIAETGSVVLVTNEGNGDLSATLPRMHIVIASLEKLVPTLEDATTLLRLLGRSATGQEITAYTSFFTGPRRTDDIDGPDEFHVILVDNGRSALLGSAFHEILYCIRCGACLNHCPVYGAIGGHAYGWVYPGPMGAVLTPLLLDLQTTKDLPQASSLCGRCEAVCPLHIPLPKLLRQLRIQHYQHHITPLSTRWALALWGFVAQRPGLYQALTQIKIKLLGILGRHRGAFSYLPLARHWTYSRDMPAPTGETFMHAWKKKQKEDS
ncbi:MAG: lactate utilization protein B, partial [Pseudomonadota bacterium]|nr:lactate utilization protein B [Pseudomonadota bacterium]